jgi:SAM-dependent methyltransferase
MLARARARAEEAGVVVDWVQGDATRFDLGQRFDAAICLCEGAFGLLSAADDPWDQPLAILSNISRALRPGAPVALTARRAGDVPPVVRRRRRGRPLRPRHVRGDVRDGTARGAEPVAVRERGFTPSELTLLFPACGARGDPRGWRNGGGLGDPGR